MSRIPSDEEVRQAIRRGDVRRVKQWVHSGELDVNREIWLGRNALHGAAWCHQVEMMEAMIQAGWDVDIQSDSGGWTALHCVMYGMNDGRYARAKSVVFTLLNAGCNPNICDTDGLTALHWVVIVSNRVHSQEEIQVIMEVIQMLIDKGADITIKDQWGKTALDWSSREEVSSLLKKCPQIRIKKKQLAEAAQEYVNVLPDPPDSDEVLLKFKQERGNRKPEIELVQAGGHSDECSSKCNLRMEMKSTYSAHFKKSLTTALSSVALLNWSNRLCGTAFRVGTRYMLTNYHVVKALPPGIAVEDIQSRLAHFNYDRHPQHQGDDPFQLKFTPNPVVWHDLDLDIAILELAPQDQQTHFIPPPLEKFLELAKNTEVHFIGHPGGKHKQFDDKCIIVQDEFVRRANDLAAWSMKTYGLNHYNKLTDANRVLYQVSDRFLHGASGSPGFVIGPHDEACVSVVHTCGYPPVDVQPPTPFENTVEQGIRIEAVFEKLQLQNPALCKDIFKQ